MGRIMMLALAAALASGSGCSVSSVTFSNAGPDGADAMPVDAGPIDAPPSSAPMSCTALPRSCGTTGNETCCESGPVPGGTFLRSYDVAGDSSSGSDAAPATVSGFALDKFEVTVGRFRAFVSAGRGVRGAAPLAGAGAHRAIPGSGWRTAWNDQLSVSRDELSVALQCEAFYQTWTDRPGANETRPITCVTWYEAMAFCIWDGGFLPTEAEWNYAASGGDQQRAYPWSTPPASLELTPTHASFFDGEACFGDGAPACTVGDVIPAGGKPSGVARWGHSELAGNVLEWVLDANASYLVPCSNCARLDGAERVVRGGGFDSDAVALRSGSRGSLPADGRNYAVGFRCAR